LPSGSVAPEMKLPSSVLVATLLSATACGSKDTKATEDSAKKADTRTAVTSSASAAASSAAPPAAPPPPAAVAAVRAGKLQNPATKKEVPLVETSLAKCFGFKGYSMMVPEGSTLETISGARACGVFLPDAKKKFGLLIMTDEVKVKMWKREDVENVKQKHLDDKDAFLYATDKKGKVVLSGWTDAQVGPHRVQCNSMRDDDTMSLDDELAFIEVCRTLKYTEPPKK
jgi:hypothetical protein